MKSNSGILRGSVVRGGKFMAPFMSCDCINGQEMDRKLIKVGRSVRVMKGGRNGHINTLRGKSQSVSHSVQES